MSGRSLLREPLVHFLVLGACLFAIDAFRRGGDDTTIVVTQATVEALVEEREDLLLRPLTPDERAKLVSGWIDEEVLLREAYRLGLDEEDGAIRSRLLEKMRFLLDEEPLEPSREELEELYFSDPERYESPRTTTFRHVFFAREEEATEAALEELRAGADPGSLGEDFWLGGTIRDISDAEVSRTFGQDFARELSGLELEQWCGPVRSSRGAHFVRVERRREPRLPSFDETSWLVREDWLRRERERVLGEKLAEIRRRYRVRAPDER
jgi:hypothetical protein